MACGIIPWSAFSTIRINHGKDIGPNWGEVSRGSVHEFPFYPIDISTIHAPDACLLRILRLPFAIFAVAKTRRF
jgi:hypothetical protein